MFENTPDVSHIYLKNTSSYGKNAFVPQVVLILTPDR